MPNIKLGIFLLFLFSLSFCQEVTWQDCLKLAREHNDDLLLARQAIDIAAGNKNITAGGLYPQASSSLSLQRAQGTLASSYSDSYSLQFSASQLLYDFGKTYSSVEGLEHTLQAAKYDYDVKSALVQFNLRKAFLQVYQSQEQVKLNHQIALRRKDQFALVKLNYDAGQTDKGALLLAQSNVWQSDGAERNSIRSLVSSQKGLVQIIGLDPGVMLTVTGTIISKIQKPQPTDLSKVAESAASIKEDMEKINTYLAQLKSSQASAMPSIYVSGTDGFSGICNNQSVPEYNSWSAVIYGNYTILDGGANAAQQRVAKTIVDEYVVQEKQALKALIIQLQQALIDLQNQQDNLGVAQKYAEAMQERLKIADGFYADGQISFDQWMLEETDYINATNQLLSAHVSELTAEANLIYLKGGTIENAIH